MQAHPHPQRLRSPPRLARQRPLRCDRRRHPGIRRRERGVEPVARRLHHVARRASRSRSRTISSWRASASRIASGCSSHRRVEPSRSVNKKVTVPDGNSVTLTPFTGEPEGKSTRQTGPPSPARRAAQNSTRSPVGPSQSRRSVVYRISNRQQATAPDLPIGARVSTPDRAIGRACGTQQHPCANAFRATLTRRSETVASTRGWVDATYVGRCIGGGPPRGSGIGVRR